MHILGQRLGEAVRERLEDNGAVVVVILFEALDMLIDTNARRDRECTNVVGVTVTGRCDKVGKTRLRMSFCLGTLLTQVDKTLRTSFRSLSA